MLSALKQGKKAAATSGVTIRNMVSAVIWSGDLTFSSPEADFSASDVGRTITSSSSQQQQWSRSLSFTSPEIDFTVGDPSWAKEPKQEWSQSLSFASPESDFVSVNVNDEASTPVHAVINTEWSKELSFASPESDFSALVARISIASPESATGQVPASTFLPPHHMETLTQATEHVVVAASKEEEPLPRTLADALGDPMDPRAIVVTQAVAPFRVVDVNDSWVGLCGFSKAEARHQTLEMIQGPATDREAVKGMVKDLLHGQESSIMLTNYTKDGRRFHNHLRVRPLVDSQNQTTHFVGVLREVTEQQYRKQMAA